MVPFTDLPSLQAWLYQRLPMFQRQGAPAYKKDLSRTRALLAAVGNPHQGQRYIHVAGTNGKGSVCAMLASILQESGTRVGLMTSPHRQWFTERFRINGLPAGGAWAVQWVQQHLSLIDEIEPSFFELITVMGLAYFAEKSTDWAVIEVGMGGRLDSTNVIMPQLSVINNISLEHTQFLGSTRAAIAGEKAGIIKPSVPALIGEDDPETRPVYEAKAQAEGASLHFCTALQLRLMPSDPLDDQRVSLKLPDGEDFPQEVVLPLLGAHQLNNLSTALHAVLLLRQAGYTMSNQAIVAGMQHLERNAGLWGRLEVIHRNPPLILDAAHNAAGIQALFNYVNQLPISRWHVVLGFSADKDLAAILPFLPKAALYYATAADIPRAMPPSELEAQLFSHNLQATAYATSAAAMQQARLVCGPVEGIIVCGSLFLVAEVRHLLLGS